VCTSHILNFEFGCGGLDDRKEQQKLYEEAESQGGLRGVVARFANSGPFELLVIFLVLCFSVVIMSQVKIAALFSYKGCTITSLCLTTAYIHDQLGAVQETGQSELLLATLEKAASSLSFGGNATLFANSTTMGSQVDGTSGVSVDIMVWFELVLLVCFVLEFLIKFFGLGKQYVSAQCF